MALAADIFIGRQTEVDALVAALDEARLGHPRLALIAGEPGIGKTRMALELADHAARRTARPIWARCLEEAGAPPYWPWAQILRSVAEPLTPGVLEACLGAGAADVASISPEIAARLPDLTPAPVFDDPAKGRFRLFRAVSEFLVAAARERTLVLILDDLHWADVPSLRLLEFLAQNMADGRLLIVGTYRETELSRRHRLSDTLGALSRVPNLLRLPLSGLGAEDVRRYVATAAGMVPPDALTAAIHDQTEGNPLFMREVVRYLAQNDQLNAAGATIRLPEGVREVIGRRLNLLSPACNDVLAVASAIGRDFSLGVLAKACRAHAEDAVLDALDEALDAHVIEATSAATWQFTHALVRLTLYEELRIGQRRRLHHAVAEAIETEHRRDLDSVAADLAFQFRASGLSEDIDRAIDYALVAARHADKTLAFEDTIGFCQNALDLLDARSADDPTRRCTLLLLLGNAQRKSGDTKGAEDTLKAGLAIARTGGPPTLYGELASAYGYTLLRNIIFIDGGGGVVPEAVALLSDALQGLPESDTALRIRLMGHRARFHNQGNAPSKAIDDATQAVAMARVLGDPGALAMALYTMSTIRTYGAADVEQVLAESVEIAALATATGQIEYASVAYSRLAMLYLQRGDLQRAKDAMASVDRTGAPDIFRRLRHAWEATFALMRGELDAAEDSIVQLMRIESDEVGADDPVSMLIFALRREQDRIRELGPLVSVFARQATKAWRPGLALMWLELGDRAAAKAVLDEVASEDFAALPQDARWAASVAFLSEVCAAIGDTTRAASLYRLLRPWSDYNIVPGYGTGCYGSAHRFLGNLAATMENRADAVQHFDAAIAMNTRIEAWLPLAHVRCDYAAMLLDRGDQAGAVSHLDLAAAFAERLGLPAVANRVAGLRARLDAPAPPAGGPDNLTPRELEVLRLLAIGRSNADVALVLDIGLPTVATHVRNILAKTGCANRTEASAYAARHGLN